MVVAEVLTGIALVKQATDFIKSNINTVKDISDIGQQIDDLFRGEKEAQQARNRKSGKGLADQFGVESVAREVIDAKLAQEKLHEVAVMVDMRFGPGTWRGIVNERARRIQEAKEAEAEARRKQQAKQKEFEENIKNFIIVTSVLLAALSLFIFVFWTVL
tara:strand:- start:6 stop:485 length:480 start_codon:yes stop_codon:yes gene_type:complete